MGQNPVAFSFWGS